MKTKDLGLGHLHSRTIGEAIEELKSLNLEADATAFRNSYSSENGSRYQPALNPKILTIQQTANALRLLQPLLGKPISYEKVGYYYNVIKKDLNQYGSTARVVTPARACDWNPKSLAKNIEASNILKSIGVEFYISRRNLIRIYCPADCFISILYESDDPVEWKNYNEKRTASLTKRRKIRKVEKRLDKV